MTKKWWDPSFLGHTFQSTIFICAPKQYENLSHVQCSCSRTSRCLGSLPEMSTEMSLNFFCLNVAEMSRHFRHAESRVTRKIIFVTSLMQKSYDCRQAASFKDTLTSLCRILEIVFQPSWFKDASGSLLEFITYEISEFTPHPKRTTSTDCLSPQ